jgi:hypothetical protein
VIAEDFQVGHAQDRARFAQLSQALLGDRLLVVPVLPGLTPPGASPNSPLVHVTTTVRMPWAE